MQTANWIPFPRRSFHSGSPGMTAIENTLPLKARKMGESEENRAYLNSLLHEEVIIWKDISRWVRSCGYISCGCSIATRFFIHLGYVHLEMRQR
jgi:hypothetical protein